MKEGSVRPSSQPINLFEFEALAKNRLPKPEYDYIAGGATDESRRRSPKQRLAV